MGGCYYTTKQGDMWDYIAWVVYGNEQMVEVLLNAEENREIMETYIFSAGVKVWCPAGIETSALEGRPPWRDDQ